MDFGPELQACHLRLSDLDRRFRELVWRDPGWLTRSSLKVPANRQRLLKYRLQPWPTFVDRELAGELRAVSLGISRLIRSLPERVFDGDPEAIDSFYGLHHPRLTEVLLAKPNSIDGAMSRGDFILTENGFQCIEFNVVANLGGWETAILAQAQLADPRIQAFLKENRASVTYTDTLQVLFSHILTEVQASAQEPPPFNIAVVTEENERLHTQMGIGEYFDGEYRALCKDVGLPEGRIVLCDYADLVETADGLTSQGTTVHAVVELYGGEVTSAVFRCFKAGFVKLYNGPITRILSDKRNIALLSQVAATDRLSAEERRLVATHVPWTRIIDGREISYDGERASLPDFLEARRENLVIKNTLRAGGAEVYVGRFTPAARWSEVIRLALAGSNWVAQELVESIPLLFQEGEEGCAPHEVIWGPFVFGDRYAGSILRMQAKSVGRVVNLTLTATEGVILEVEDSSPPSRPT